MDRRSAVPTEIGGPQEFYQALHRAFDRTLALHTGRPQLLDASLALAYDSFEGNVTIQCEGEPPLACRRGCATCCSLRVSASVPEVLMVARFLRAVAPVLAERGVDLIQQIREANARSQGLTEQERVQLRQPCPFVARGVCVIYMVRPLACRGHASHDVKACVAAAHGEVTEVPYSQGHYLVRALVQNAMQSALRDAGLAWGSTELNQAVLLALDTPDVEARWLAGDDVLASAALQEVPMTEMARVFDELRPT